MKKAFFDYHRRNIPIYGVPYAKLKDYTTSKKDMKKGVEIMPEKEYRLKADDLYTDSEEGPKIGSIAATTSKGSEFSDEFMNETRVPAKTLYAKKGDT